jgi:hypothetical protein
MHFVVMVDKLDLSVPAMIPLRPPFAEIVHAPKRAGLGGGFRPSVFYRYVVDLRPWGNDAVLHFGSKHSSKRGHKLELLETGNKSFDDLLVEIESVFDVDPEDLGVMRVDLAVDIDGVPISHFRHNARARHKQFSSQIGKLTVEFSEMGKIEVETLYFGKSPNCFRIYNKTGQLAGQYLKKYSPLLRPYFARGLNISELSGFNGLELPAVTVPSF